MKGATHGAGRQPDPSSLIGRLERLYRDNPHEQPRRGWAHDDQAGDGVRDGDRMTHTQSTIMRESAAARRSALEDAFALQLRAAGIDFQREVQFHPVRKWRVDFLVTAHPLPVAVEIEGGTWVGGRHQTGAGFTADCVKYAEAMCHGWRVLRVTADHVQSGIALQWVERLIGRSA